MSARAQRLCSGGNEPSSGAGHLGCAARVLRWSSGNSPLPARPCGRRLFVSDAGIGRCGVASSLAACPARSSGLNSQGLRAGERDISVDLLPVDEDLSNPPPYAVPLITAYGLAALNWGRLEAIMDDILIHTDTDAKQAGLPTRIPNSWSDKCDALTRRFELPRIAALAPVAARIGPELRKMGNVRNDLVHGGVLGFSPGPPARLHLRKCAFRKEQATATILTPTGAELAEFTRIVAEVRTVLTRLSFLMLQQGGVFRDLDRLIGQRQSNEPQERSSDPET
jgi:hypothetical protein